MIQNQILDLCLTITSVSNDALAQAIANIDLRCDVLGLIHSGEQLIDPISEQEHADLHWYLEEYWKWPYEGFAERGKKVELLLADIGTRLYRSAFKSVQARD